MEVLMKSEKNRNAFSGVSLHYYTGTWGWENRSATDFGEKDWFDILEKALAIDTIITGQEAIMDKFDPEKKKGLIVDEWGAWYEVEPGTNPGFLYQQNTLRDALVASLTLDIFNRHCDRVKMANIAQMVNVLQAVILTKDAQMVLTPTYYVFKMYRVHQDATMLPVKLDCENYALDSRSIPGISASASRNADGLIHITMTNLNPEKAAQLTCELSGTDRRSVKKGEIISADKMNARNDFGKPEQVSLKAFSAVKMEKNMLKVDLPAKSIIMVELE